MFRDYSSLLLTGFNNHIKFRGYLFTFMRLSISHLVPLPLKEKHNTYNATVWEQDMVFNQGEHVLITGPSGAGKTLFLNMLYGLRKDFEGKIHWSAYNMNEVTPQQLSQLRAASVSMVFQDMRLFTEMTVWENIDIKRRLTDTVPAYDAEKWLERIGLKTKLEVPVSQLSLGEQQRVAIVRALVQPFEWILMDEPFSHLDFFNKQKAVTLIKEVAGYTRAGLIITAVADNDDFVYDKKIFL